MFSQLQVAFRRWRHRRLRRRSYYLEEKIALYRRYPHSLGFEGLERIAAQERKLRRMQFAIGLVELRMQFADPRTPQARVALGADPPAEANARS